MTRYLCYLPLLFLHLSHAVSPTPAHGAPEEAGNPMASPGSGSAAGLLLSHLEDSASGADNSDLDLMKRLYDFGLGKRAYSYVSEYKRLPVYNFGLGKRSNKMYGFGLGKRSPAGGHMYSFGLGKRDYDDYYQGEDEDEDMLEQEEVGGDEDMQDDDSVDLVDKRGAHMYGFGLGKRARPYSFGLGKRAPQQKMYGFGLGKRPDGRLYSFGLGKRGEGRLYSFGLGKRPVSGRQSGSRFNFGLGKRSEDSDLVSELEDEIEQEAAMEKRVAPKAGQRFAFGLGKREVAPGELEAVRMENTAPTDKKNASAPESHHSSDIVKRSLQYAFGLGKRTPLYSDAADDVEEFSRLVRRPYSFGLGKRVPMYNFGIGKRSEH